MNAFQKLLDFLLRLDSAHIHYSLAHFRDETIAVEVVVPGERWEVEFFADGRVEIEIFTSVGPSGIALEDENALERLFAVHST
jgi:hypothetical protein